MPREQARTSGNLRCRPLVPTGSPATGSPATGYTNPCLQTTEWDWATDPTTQPDLATELAAGDYGMQLSHDLDELLGRMLRAGPTIRDLYEDTNGEGRLHVLGVPTMMAVGATRDAWGRTRSLLRTCLGTRIVPRDARVGERGIF